MRHPAQLHLVVTAAGAQPRLPINTSTTPQPPAINPSSATTTRSGQRRARWRGEPDHKYF